MFTHIMVGANDIDAAKAFYDAIFAAAGGEAGKLDHRGRIVYRKDGTQFMVTKPINGEPATGANGGTIGFALTSPEMVDAWHAAGVANGGKSVEDPPGLREGGTRKNYLAYLHDPTGNKLCGRYLISE